MAKLKIKEEDLLSKIHKVIKDTNVTEKELQQIATGLRPKQSQYEQE